MPSSAAANFERRLARRARAGGQRLRVAQAVTATLLAEAPLSCVFAFCDFVLPADGVVCASRDSLTVRHAGPCITGDHTEHLDDENAGDIADVACGPSHLVVSRGNGFQVTAAIPCDAGRGARLETHTVFDSHAAQVIAVDVTPAGLVATGCVDGSIAVWDAPTYTADADGRVGSPLVLAGHSDWVRMLRFGSDAVGQVTLLSAGDDGKVCVWDAHSALCLHTAVFPSQSIRAVAASSCGTDATSSCTAVAVGATVVILQWARRCLTEVVRLSPHHATPVTTMALHGSVLATVSEDEEIAVHYLGPSLAAASSADSGSPKKPQSPSAVTISTPDASPRAVMAGVDDELHTPQRLFTAKARLASRLCASLMSTLTRVVILAAPPLSTAITVACASSDGDLVVVTGFPRALDTAPRSARTPTGSSGRPRLLESPLVKSWLPNLGGGQSDATEASSPTRPGPLAKSAPHRGVVSAATGGSTSTTSISTYFDAFVAQAIALRSRGATTAATAAKNDTHRAAVTSSSAAATAGATSPTSPGAESPWRVHDHSVLLETGPVVAMARCAVDFA